jgi:two-component system NtrC family sensor kinase
MIRVEITDNGPGIPAESLPRIFDPFFTTKPTGQGTGLGLSIGYGIVQEHDGRISARSQPGLSTTFRIELPVLSQPAGQGAAAPSEDSATGLSGEGAAPLRLLVVDDEPSIVEILSEALRACGHTVDSAVNGKLALRMLEKGTYDGIISDLKMPGMSGQELFRHAGALRPGLASRFVFATGDVVNRDTRQFLETSGRPWVEKPFELGRVIRLLTDVAGASGKR